MAPPIPNPGSQPLTHAQFIRLFLQAERELLRYVMALVPDVNDARDVVQETAVALWKAIEKYDPAKPFVPWACRFGLNKARMFLRTEGRRRRFLEEDVAGLLEDRRVELAAKLDARREHLHDCLGRLPGDQHQLVRAYYFDEQSIEALALTFGRGTEAIYKSLQRIRRALQNCIERKLQLKS